MALKQKREEILTKIFPFNDLKTIVLNSLQATVIMAIPSCPGQNRLSEVAPKSMSQFSDTLLYFCGCPSQTFLAKSSFIPNILILSEDRILGRSLMHFCGDPFQTTAIKQYFLCAR